MSAEPIQIQVHAPVAAAQHERSRSADEIRDEDLQERLALAFAAGRVEGLHVQLESGREALEGAAERLDQAREHAEAEMSKDTVELAVQIASKLLMIEIRAGSYDLERMVRSALSSSGVGRGECVVHVCPDDAKRLDGVPWRSGTVVEPDPNLAPGGVQITTPKGLLVRDMELALDSIREQLLEEFA